MNGRGMLLVVISCALIVCASVSNANITNVTYYSDGDGAFVCPNYVWEGNSAEVALYMYGDQLASPGHVLTDVYATDALDPTLKINNSIENATSFAWTQFTVNLTMDVSFTLTNVTVTTPADWTVVSFNQTAVYTGSNYLATVVYDTGTPIPNDGYSTIDFGYWVVFSGAPSYQLCQEFIPVPEPGTMVLVAIGGLFLGRSLMRRRQQL
jgi:hypothetical protein